LSLDFLWCNQYLPNSGVVVVVAAGIVTGVARGFDVIGFVVGRAVVVSTVVVGAFVVVA